MENGFELIRNQMKCEKPFFLTVPLLPVLQESKKVTGKSYIWQHSSGLTYGVGT